jgi:hypothetical protein
MMYFCRAAKPPHMIVYGWTLLVLTLTIEATHLLLQKTLNKRRLASPKDAEVRAGL